MGIRFGDKVWEWNFKNQDKKFLIPRCNGIQNMLFTVYHNIFAKSNPYSNIQSESQKIDKRKKLGV